MFNYFIGFVSGLVGNPDQIILGNQRNAGHWILRDGMVAVVEVTWMGYYNQVTLDLDVLGTKVPCGAWKASKSAAYAVASKIEALREAAK